MSIDKKIKEIFNGNYIKVPINCTDESKGHGSALSVKIVIPIKCQANCSFCFNKINKTIQSHDKNLFLSNLKISLNLLKENIITRKITLDITGNEPTFDIELLKEVLSIIREFNYDNISKVVLTTNGFNLSKLNDLNPINIINISLHHYDFKERIKIFGTKNIPDNNELIDLCSKFNITAVAVFDETRDDLESFTKDFANWAEKTGFKNVRIRTNYLSEGSVFFNAFKDITPEKLVGLYVKELDFNGYNVKLYRGIEDLTACIIGPEIIIDDNGKPYLDYYKRYPISSEELKAFDSSIYIKA